jgi:fructose-1,6-bisphosphatase/inositol monophosphatase family enzyme
MSLHSEVAALLRDVAAHVVLPRFRALRAQDIAEKSPGEIVTVVDRDAERMLCDGLDRLNIGARIVGEEAAAQYPEVLDGIGSGLVWLVDPLDGTANFAEGRVPFGMMIALVSDGLPIASWMFDPMTGRMCQAALGKGAMVDGVVVRSRQKVRLQPIASLATQFMAPDRRACVHDQAEQHFRLVPIPRCAAESYPRLVLGQNDVALFQRILPWDHAAGVLFLEEAGGRATPWDGTPSRVGSHSSGLLVAATDESWQLAAETFLDAAIPARTLEVLAA